MARKLNIVLSIALVVVASMLHVSLGQTTHVVGDRLGWTVPPGGDIAYRTWAATQTFTVGDVLVFNFTTGTHDVVEVNRDEYNSCNSTSPISTSTSGPTRITLTTAGQHNFICNFPSHCTLGQRLSINVSAATATTPSPAPQAATPSPTATPETVPSPASTPAAAPTPSRIPTTHIVGNSLGWTVPPGGIAAYQTWARDQSFMVGDILVFNFTTGAHDVAEVSRTGYDSCNTNPNTNIINNGPARVTLTSAGEHHYICTIPSHCSLGQRLAINVTDAGGATSMPPSSTTPAPSGSTPPPPNNSASSLGVKALPFTFLAIALALFYY